jgi:hypothetical protein
MKKAKNTISLKTVIIVGIVSLILGGTLGSLLFPRQVMISDTATALRDKCYEGNADWIFDRVVDLRDGTCNEVNLVTYSQQRSCNIAVSDLLGNIQDLRECQSIQ